jgi:hypothetical protein
MLSGCVRLFWVQQFVNAPSLSGAYHTIKVLQQWDGWWTSATALFRFSDGFVQIQRPHLPNGHALR